MNWPDYILTLTSALLKTQDNKLQEKLSYFNSIIFLDTIKTPKTISVGARAEDNSETPFTKWMQTLRSEKIQHIALHNFNDTTQSLPDHILAAFAGGHNYILQISTEVATHSYVLLFTTGPNYMLTYPELTTLIDAQQLKEKIWERVIEYINDSNEMNNRPIIAPEKMRSYLLNDAPKDMPDFLLTDIVSEIQVECAALDTRFVIPDTYKNSFEQFESNTLFGGDFPEMPRENFESEIEYRRANARSNQKKWYVKQNNNNWHNYFFERITISPTKTTSNSKNDKKEAFIQALTDIKQFAAKIESPYEEAFSLALLFTSNELPEGQFDKEHIQAITAFITNKGFSERAQSVFTDKAYYLEDFWKMGYTKEAVFHLFAINTADVFGGMGSWNDEPVSAENSETYHNVSATLFSAMKTYFISILE